MDSQILVVGPEGGGKTMLLKRLQSYTSQSSSGTGNITLCEPPSTISTVGVNLVTLQINKKKYSLRELGGAMAAVWSNYFKDCTHCIYVVDIANRGQVSAATILLLNLLSSLHTSSWPVLVLLNKIDIPSCMTQNEIASFMRMEDIQQCSTQNVTVLETCFHDGRGLTDVINWLKNNYEK